MGLGKCISFASNTGGHFGYLSATLALPALWHFTALQLAGWEAAVRSPTPPDYGGETSEYEEVFTESVLNFRGGSPWFFHEKTLGAWKGKPWNE